MVCTGKFIGSACVAVGEHRNLPQELIGNFDALRAEAVLFVTEGAAEKGLHLVGGERGEHVDLGAGKQRGVDFERGIFGCCANQHDVAALDVGQKRVLLSLVEAVNFVDEEDRAASELAQALGLSVDITHKGGRGSLTVRYGTLEQLDEVCRRLRR
jgi:hypothetical protein